jgi:hypothetical protein
MVRKAYTAEQIINKLREAWCISWSRSLSPPQVAALCTKIKLRPFRYVLVHLTALQSTGGSPHSSFEAIFIALVV